MSYSSDLLVQAKHLAKNEPKRPKQASLKRAVSAAYYSLFHFLIAEAASFMVKGAGAKEIRPVFQRAFVHSHMKNAAKRFVSGNLPDRWMGMLGGESISPELDQVASAFVELQEARHEADYDISRQFSRHEATDLIEMSEKATGTWRGIKATVEAHVFLAALLVFEKIPKS